MQLITIKFSKMISQHFSRVPLPKDPPCCISGKIKEHILEEIPTGPKKKKNTTTKCTVYSFREGTVKHYTFEMTFCPPAHVPAILPVTLLQNIRRLW